ncbi:MAG: hypothetical protein F2923_06130 [Actinobacteria bacterium]|uniref:Unannotated protein n=1 Tax=freshwater metagenome TaxID=449393 RepID=A0A6J7SI52_9ZZZZ|nr:hypothetical protein [Actinomycetota bacterium]
MKHKIAQTITAVAVLGITTVGALTPAIAVSHDTGLFGSTDPTYDGVYRQSLAILALQPLNKVPAESVTWLAGQQCLDGSFEEYRNSIRTACAQPDPAKFTGADSNATALGAMALRIVKNSTAADKAIAVLLTKQNKDGGWGYTLGGESDVNSTGLVLAALNSAPKTSALRNAGNSARGYLTASQIPCTGAGTFGLPYQPNGKADNLASAQALVGIAGTLPANKPTAYASVTKTSCKSALVNKVATYLSQTLVASKGALKSALDPKQTDWNSTASAVIGLASSKQGKPGLDAGLAQLQSNVVEYTGTGAKFKAAAGSGLIMIAGLTGKNPQAFGSQKSDLVANLLTSITK